jgi:bidirectional [NiFe] hydrogenase diaphorase subunit
LGYYIKKFKLYAGNYYKIIHFCIYFKLKMTIMATWVQNGRHGAWDHEKKDCICQRNRKRCDGLNNLSQHPSFATRRNRMVASVSEHLSAGDRRWKDIDQAMQRHDYRPDALIETLHAAQDAFGYLDSVTLAYISSKLKTPPSKVYGVATFYNHFRLKPKGDHTLVVCTGTACHVKGNDRILAWIRDQYSLVPGETTPDNRLSLLEVRCVGACALAPVILPDGAIIGKKNFKEATTIIGEWLGNAT